MYLSSYCSTAEYHRCWYFWLVLQYKMLHFLLCFSFFMIVLTNPTTRLKPNNECVPFEPQSANSQPVVAYAAVQLTSSSSKNYYRRGEKKKCQTGALGWDILQLRWTQAERLVPLQTHWAVSLISLHAAAIKPESRGKRVCLVITGNTDYRNSCKRSRGLYPDFTNEQVQKHLQYRCMCICI